LIRRTGIVFPVAVIAAIAVIGVAIAASVSAPGTNAAGANAVFEAIPGSQTVAALEAERQQLIAMTTAAGTLTVVTKPKLASPGQVVAASNLGESTATGGITYVPSTPPNPSTAQSIAYNMMGSFGFPPTVYFGCLNDLWQRESGWLYDAENPVSGAYGIPQSLPGGKMASAGADWQTDPATQIRWGLGYIKGQYGNPCSAWAFEEANGFY
jgi:resuscitation-promoting factor RpfB